MNTNTKNKILLTLISVITLSLSSCLPVMDAKVLAVFKNCTKDTLYIGASNDNNINNVEAIIGPCYEPVASTFDTTGISLWNENSDLNISNSYVCPDSSCYYSGDDKLFGNPVPRYFFLIKYKDAKNHSWDEIRNKKLYTIWISKKNKDGRFETNIKTEDIVTP